MTVLEFEILAKVMDIQQLFEKYKELGGKDLAAYITIGNEERRNETIYGDPELLMKILCQSMLHRRDFYHAAVTAVIAFEHLMDSVGQDPDDDDNEEQVIAALEAL